MTYYCSHQLFFLTSVPLFCSLRGSFVLFRGYFCTVFCTFVLFFVLCGSFVLFRGSFSFSLNWWFLSIPHNLAETPSSLWSHPCSVLSDRIFFWTFRAIYSHFFTTQISGMIYIWARQWKYAFICYFSLPYKVFSP